MLVFTAGRELGSVYTLIRRRGMLPNTKVKGKKDNKASSCADLVRLSEFVNSRGSGGIQPQANGQF